MDDDKKKPQDDGLTRREVLVKGAVTVGAAAVGVYVPPKLTRIPLPVKPKVNNPSPSPVEGSEGRGMPNVLAKAAPANKESCEKNPSEDCGKCIADKDPGEKTIDGKNKETNLDKCVTDKPCDKDPSTDKPGDKQPGSEQQSGFPPHSGHYNGPETDEWG